MKPVGWTQRLQSERARALPDPGKAAPRAAGKLGCAPNDHLDRSRAQSAPKLDLGRLTAAKIPEKLAAEHAAILERALPDAAAIAAFTQKLEPWRTKAIDRIVDQFYKSLGLALNRAEAGAEPEHRAALAASTTRAFRELIEKLGPADALGPAMNAAIGLFELGLRHSAQKRLDTKPADQQQAFSAAARAVLDLREALEGRTGAGTALNIFPVLVEQLERAQPKLTAASRRELWSEVTRFLAATGPLTGFTQELGAELAKHLGEAIAGADVAKTLARAADRFRADHAIAREEISAQLAADPGARLAAGTPGREVFDTIRAALEKTALAHPVTSDALKTAIFNLYNTALNEAQARPPAPNRPNYWPAAAKLIEQLGPTELALPALTWLQANLPLFAGRPAAAEALIRAAAAPDATGTARELADAAFLLSGFQQANMPALKAELDRLAELPARDAMRVFLALAPVLRSPNQNTTPLVVRHAIELAQLGGKDDPIKFLGEYATRDAAFLDGLTRYNVSAQDPGKREAIAAALAAASAGLTVPGNAGNLAATMLRSIEANLPRLQLSEVAGGDAGVWPLINPGARRRHPVQPIADQLFAALNRAGISRREGEAQLEPARLALQLAAQLSNLDGDYRVPFERVRQDFEAAFRDPTQLKLAPRERGAAEVRGFQKQPSVAAFLAAHPELPLELSFTAGLHLTPEQLAWTIDKCGKATGRDTKRALRDLIFACVSNNRLDLLEAVRVSQSPAKPLSKTISFVARCYREGKMNEVPYDALIKGLRAGEDPIAAIDQARIQQTLAKLNLQDLAAGGQLDPAGMEDIAKSAEALTYLFEYFKPNFNSDGIDHGPLRPIMLDVVRAVAQGTWPKEKYENEPGKAQMAKLSPEQQAIWREELVTSGDAGGNKAELAERAEAVQLARGLAKAMELQAQLRVPGVEKLAWDAPSLARVEALYQQQIAQIRELQKGSEQHRAASKALGATRDALCLLRLHQAINAQPADSKTALLGLRDLLGDAASVLRRQKLAGAAEAATRIGFVARDLKSSPKQGLYACDEDNLAALTTSCTGGCIHYTNVRRWALSSLTANANEKIIRVYDGDKFVYRAILKFFNAKFDGYEGPVLWINQPNQNGGGGTQEQRELLIRHAILKAQAMGIPVLSRYAEPGAAAKSLGLQVEQKNVTLQIDEGTTGLQYIDYLLRAPGPNYAYAYDIKKLRGNQPYFEGQIDQVYVVKTR